jgi:hypothetical protein
MCERERERERERALHTNIKKQKSSKKWTKKDLFRLHAAYGVRITTITTRVGGLKTRNKRAGNSKNYIGNTA